jgi:Ni/Co efflux regulator RcnB
MKKSKALLGVLAVAGVLAAAPGFAQKSHGHGKPAAAAPADSAGPTGMVPRTWEKGDMLTTEYRDRQYVIDNYKQYGLPAPSKGNHWVGIGAQYLLVSGKGKVMDIGQATM